MDAAVCGRLREAVDFLKKNGYAGSDSGVAERVGVSKSTLCMAMNGTRMPTWGMLLDLCDVYPVNFWWLRSGRGAMVREDREAALLKRIEELERELETVRRE